MQTFIRRALFAVLVFPAVAAATDRRESSTISRTEIEAAQKGWCDALLEISTAGRNGKDAKAIASRVLSTAYNYDHGGTVFKPTLTHGDQTFRMTKEGALAYFVGGDPSYPSDSGFALKPWVRCEAKVLGVVGSGNMSVAMGNVELTDASGAKVKVDKTFGYVRGADGALRIAVHHSSLPFVRSAK